ncbi:MAG TPA: hypothetical protein VMS76_10385 [Planctomycetota bacterium]|nr:hypothetical protein [Planctomycetota bacterium]
MLKLESSLQVLCRREASVLLAVLLACSACAGPDGERRAERPAAHREAVSLARIQDPDQGEVRLWLAIEFPTCGAYRLTDPEDQQRVLRSLHGQILVDSGLKDLKEWGRTEATPDLFNPGLQVAAMRRLAERELTKLGGTIHPQQPGLEVKRAYKPEPSCPPGATCRVDREQHVVTGQFLLLRDGKVWTVQEPSKLGVVLCEVKVYVEVVTPIAH